MPNPRQKTFKRRSKKINYKKRLWKLFSEYIRRRDGGLCVTCGKVGSWKYDMEAGHFFAAGSCGLSLYFDERNVNSQCTRCNRFLHGNLIQYTKYLQREYGSNIIKELEDIKHLNEGEKWNTTQYQELIHYYKTALEVYQDL